MSTFLPQCNLSSYIYIGLGVQFLWMDRNDYIFNPDTRDLWDILLRFWLTVPYTNGWMIRCWWMVKDVTSFWLGNFWLVVPKTNDGLVLNSAANLGFCSIIVAKLIDVLFGLRYAPDKGCRRILVHVNSKCALTLILEPFPSTHPAMLWVGRIKSLLQREWEIKLSHIFRESNSVADAILHILVTHVS